MPTVVVPLVAAAITAAIPAAGAVAFGTVTYATLASAVIVTGALAGAAMAFAPRRKPQGGQLPSVPGAVTMVSRASTVSNRFYGFGLVSDGGVMLATESENGYLGSVICIDSGPIDGIQAIYCDNELLQLSNDPFKMPVGDLTTGMATFDLGRSVYWPYTGIKSVPRFTYLYDPVSKQVIQFPIGSSPAVFVEWKLGSVPGVPSSLWRGFFGDDPFGVIPSGSVIGWGADHRADNLSVLYTVASKFRATDVLSAFPELFPKWRTIRRGARVYDPRDEDQDVDDPSTWQWSQNPALARAWHAMHVDGLRHTPAEINWATIATAANDCDALVPAFGSTTEPFARCNFQWDTGMERRDVEALIDISCDGFSYYDHDGKFCYRIYKNETPTLTFTGEDISSIVEEHTGGPFSADTVFVGSYVEPRQNFQTTSAPEIADTDGVTAIGRYVQTLQHDAVHSFSQSYRLTHRAMRRVNPKRRITITGGWSLMRARRHRVVEIDFPEAGVEGTFWIDGPIGAVPTLEKWSLTLIELHADAFNNVVPPRDPINPALAVPIPNAGNPPAPTGLTLTQQTISTLEYVQGSVTDPGDPSLILHMQIKPTSGSTWSSMPTVVDQWVRLSEDVTPGSYDVRAWYVNFAQKVGPFSSTATITVV